jgi:hypothetical protein
MTLRNSVDAYLQRQLTREGAADCAKLTQLLEDAALSDSDDVRSCPLANKHEQLKTSALYRALMSTASTAPCPYACFIGKN